MQIPRPRISFLQLWSGADDPGPERFAAFPGPAAPEPSRAQGSSSRAEPGREAGRPSRLLTPGCSPHPPRASRKAGCTPTPAHQFPRLTSSAPWRPQLGAAASELWCPGNNSEWGAWDGGGVCSTSERATPLPPAANQRQPCGNNLLLSQSAGRAGARSCPAPAPPAAVSPRASLAPGHRRVPRTVTDSHSDTDVKGG